MVGLIIRPSDLTTERTNPVASEFMVVDNGVTVAKSTISDVVLAGRPTASQAEAEAGTDPSKAMTPLTTRQAINERLTNSSILSAVARTGGYADLIGAPPGLTDGDKGDVIVSSSGTAWSVSRRFNTVAILLADTSMAYAAGTQTVAAGQIVEAQGFRYAVAASGASDNDVVTAGGVKLNVRNDVLGYNLLAFGWKINDSSAPAKAINDDIMAKVVAKATGSAQGGILVVVPVGKAFYSQTWNFNRRDITVVGQNRASSFLKFRPATDIPAINIGTDSGAVIQNISLTGFAIEGAEVGQESVASLGIRAFHWRYLTIDLELFRFNKPSTGLGAHFIGGDRAAGDFSAYHRIKLNVDSCTNNGLFIGSTIVGEDAPVNDGRWDIRVAGTGGNRGVVLHQGYQNIITGDVELYDTTVEIYANGNYIDHVIVEQAQTKGIKVGPLVKELGIINSSLSSLVFHEANWPIHIDSYNGVTAWRAIDGAGENLLLNGDFYDGANGLGSWNGSNLFWTGNKWRYRTDGGTDPSGPFVFVPGSFKANTWYSIVFEAWLDAGASVSTAALRLRVNGGTDPGYNTGSGESLLQTEAALNINGGTANTLSIPSSAIPNDGVRRKFVKRFFTGSNTNFPSTLELYSPTGAFTGGYLNVEWAAVFEGTVPPNFQLSRVDIAHRKTGSLQYSAVDTLPTHTTSFNVSERGGSYLIDSTSGNVVPTLPSAKAAGKGTRVFFKKLVAANTVTITAAASQNVDGASTYAISTQWGKVTLESNGLDRWYVVAS